MEDQYPEENESIRKIIVLISKIQEILIKFTNKKLRIYLGIKELAFLLKNYIEKELKPEGDSECFSE